MKTNSPDHSTGIGTADKEKHLKNGQYAISLEKTLPQGSKTQLIVPTSQQRRTVTCNNRALARRTNSRTSNRTANALLARRKVIRLLIAVIVSFATCVLPYHIRVLWQTWGEPHLSFWTSLLTPVTFLIFYLNSGLNPMLYAFLSDNFRRSLREVLFCGRDRLRRGMSTMSSTFMRTGSTAAGNLMHNNWSLIYYSRLNTFFCFVHIEKYKTNVKNSLKNVHYFPCTIEKKTDTWIRLLFCSSLPWKLDLSSWRQNLETIHEI